MNLGTYVTGLVNAVDKEMADEVAPYDLIPLEFNILRACMQNGECTATQLAEILPIDASRASRMVTRLVNMGLLRRRRLRNDRRVVMLRLTETGNELTAHLHERVQIHYSKLIKGVNEREMRGFVSTTLKIVANYAALKQSQ